VGEVQAAIEARLAGKAVEPQALVIDKQSPANSVTASGETLKGALVPLSPGDRLLQVIAAAGGVHAPVRDTYVELSRGGVSATIPLETLVAHPDQDIYAVPGDTLTLLRVPHTFSIFGATRRNAEIPFGADRLSLAEALAKSQGLDDKLANPKGVFLFRWERDPVVRALGEPIADGAPAGLSPIAYRFDLRDAKSYLLASVFPVHDKDLIFVADADVAPLKKVFEVVGTVVGPFRTALLVCASAKC
jgi:polysaccharide export outer membrane protein